MRSVSEISFMTFSSVGFIVTVLAQHEVCCSAVHLSTPQPSIQIFPIFFRLAAILCHTTFISGCLWSSCEISSVRPWYLGSAFSGSAMSHRLFLILQKKEYSASLVLLLTKPQQRILILFSAVKVKNSIKTLTLRKAASVVVFTVTAALPCFFCSADLLCLASVLSIVQEMHQRSSAQSFISVSRGRIRFIHV